MTGVERQLARESRRVRREWRYLLRRVAELREGQLAAAWMLFLAVLFGQAVTSIATASGVFTAAAADRASFLAMLLSVVGLGACCAALGARRGLWRLVRTVPGLAELAADLEAGRGQR